MRQVVLGVPIMIWRSGDDSVRAFVDICPHRQAPLSGGTVDEQGVTCPYHGWRFGPDGLCNQMPVMPESQTCSQNVSLISVVSCEHASMVWVWMGKSQPEKQPEYLPNYGDNEWRFTTAKTVFAFDLDDVVENFMDFAHTAVVHPGLIRGISDAQERSIEIETTDQCVRSVHEAVHEKVGMFSGLFVPRGKPIQHSDTFLLPGNVLVEYWFGDDSPTFVAFLGMTPIDQQQTQIMLMVGTRLGWANFPISLALPKFIRKVLDQDERILVQQRANLDLVSDRKMTSLQPDSIDSTVRALRKHFRDPTLPRPKPGVRHIRVRV